MQSLYTKLNSLPETLKSEVIDYMEFLLKKHAKDNDKKKPKFGCSKAFYKMSDDFDAPLEDFKEYTL